MQHLRKVFVSLMQKHIAQRLMKAAISIYINNVSIRDKKTNSSKQLFFFARRKMYCVAFYESWQHCRKTVSLAATHTRYKRALCAKGMTQFFNGITL